MSLSGGEAGAQPCRLPESSARSSSRAEGSSAAAYTVSIGTDFFFRALRPDTLLVAMMHANITADRE